MTGTLHYRYFPTNISFVSLYTLAKKTYLLPAINCSLSNLKNKQSLISEMHIAQPLWAKGRSVLFLVHSRAEDNILS